MSTTNDTPDNENSAEFPSNQVEETLGFALTQSREEDPESEGEESGAITAFITTLREGDLWVPLPQGSGQQEDGSIALPTLELEGSTFIPAFTSESQLSVRSADLPFTVIATRDLAEVLPEGVGLALNPGNTMGVPIYPETVAVLARQ